MLDGKHLDAMLEKTSDELDLVCAYIANPHFCEQDQEKRDLIRELQTTLIRQETVLRTLADK